MFQAGVRLSRIGGPLQAIRAIALPPSEAWLVGDFAQLMVEVDRVTRNTKRIGLDFLAESGEDYVAIDSFHWLVEVPDPKTKSLLNIGLWLVPRDERGCIILAQQILRIEENKYVYWGVD